MSTDNATHHFTNRAHIGMVCVYCGRSAAHLRTVDPTTEPSQQLCDKVAPEAGPRVGVVSSSDLGNNWSAEHHLDRLDREAGR